ncbi:hypothetical protein BH20ACT2_BH20ACT2_01140 [soil metagenome]
MPGDERLFVVTTRSRLKSARYFPSMMLASMRIRRQLKSTGEVVRWASVVASPTEFWTITAWRSRHEMQEFMHSGAHDDIMWLFSRWLRSFWLMRWKPGPTEVGAWKGATFACAPPEPPQAALADGASDAAAEEERQRKLMLALEHFPRLKAATGPDGAACYDATPFAQRRRKEVGTAGGAVVHLKTSLWRTPGAIRALRKLRAECDERGGLLRSVVGVGRPGEIYLLALWRDSTGPAQLLASPTMQSVAERWPVGCWANEWVPENEFGHWDGLRVRRARGRHAVKMTPAQAALGETPDFLETAPLPDA